MRPPCSPTPNHAFIYLDLGRNHTVLKEMDRATQSFERATQLDPNDPYLASTAGLELL